MGICCNADRICMYARSGRAYDATDIHLPQNKFISRFSYALIAALMLALLFGQSAQAEGNALNGAYEWVRTCQHCHGKPQPNNAEAFSDYGTTANKLSVYANDPAAITKAANEGYIVPEGNTNDKVDPGANTNDPMGTWSGMGPKRLGVGRTPTQYAMDFSAYFASLFSPPEAPSIGAATAGNAQATVSFSPPKSDLTITSYTVTANPGGITAVGTASPITVTGLNNGMSYSFTVTAASNAGTGKTSTPSNSVTPNAALGSPAAAAVTSSVAARPSVPAPAMAVTPPPAVARPVAPVVPSAASPAVVHPGNVVPSKAPTAAATVAQPPGPSAPVIRFIRAGSAEAKVYFDGPANANISGYTVTALSNGKSTGITAKGISSPITVTGLTNGTDYTFTVTASTSTGKNVTSFPSNVVTPLRLLGE